ncbi:STT3 domain-containing protein [Campylobacter curvus]|uniref:STT3 domain-containing protein n=1 Tax=Campylobacter curvus TaxID=200 RepID=UPI00146FD864|nr:STT3 domain-containing protein [Campylobacter curvus]
MMDKEGFSSYFKNFHLSKQSVLLIAIAFVFSVVCRLYWVVWASEFSSFFWNGELMISTNDGYAFAEGARDMLAGFHQPNDLSYFGYPLSTLTYWIVKIFGIKLEAAMLYMSVFFSSLVVIPIFLISLEYKTPKAGLIAALLGSIADSYYNRTMAGYYDTDMLIIPLSVFMLWGLVRVLEKRDTASIIIAPISILIYMWWYASAFSLISVSAGIFLVYTLIFERRNRACYAQLVLLVLSITNIDIYVKILLVFGFYLGVLFKKELLNFKFILAALAVSFALFVIGGGLNPIIFQLKFYVFRAVPESAGVSFKYFNVNQTIQESGIVDLQLFCERISSSVLTFLVSLAGVIMLCVKHRSFLVTLGMLFLGFLALKGGLRFTIYAVPVMAIGFGYFVVYFLEILKLKPASFNAAYCLIAVFALLPALSHIYNYKASPVFSRSEVEILNKLKGIAGREDYVLAWWDYGYPIRYYADVKTLIDGGKHLGRDNYAVSYALGSDETSSANMARIEVEYTERKFNERFASNMTQILEDRNISDVNVFLSGLKDENLSLPPKTREIYYYLPDRMLYIFPTILQFSRLDLKNGKSHAEGLFFIASAIAQDERGINLGNGFVLSSDVSTLSYNNMKMSLAAFIETSYDEKGRLNVKEYKNDENSKIYVIFMRDYGRFLILDESMLNSAYIQLFVLERYDERLFEPVILSGAAKVYRLKR